MKTVLKVFLVMFALIGILDAGYITYEELSGVIPACGAGFDCGKVLNSPWSHIGPVPLAALGLVYYLIIFALAASQILELPAATFKPVTAEISKYGKKYLSKKVLAFIDTHPLLSAIFLISCFGLAFSAFLIFLMGVIIKAWCLYCLISAITSCLLFVTTSSLVYTELHENTHS
jgi:uncharacterized membrane protein